MAKFQEWFNRNIWEVRASSSNMSINGKFWDYINTDGGIDSVSLTEAQKISAVWTALNIRSRTIGALPINIFQDKPGGKKINRIDHPAYYPLAHEPSNYMSSANMFLSSMINADTDGNAYLYIHRDGRTQPKGFEIWCAPEVTPKLVEGQAFYVYEGHAYPARDVLHFRWYSRDGFCGISPIRWNMATMSMAKKQDKFAHASLGSKPPGILSYEHELTPEQRVQNKEEFTKSIQDGKSPVLSGNWKFTPTMISPGDAEYLGSRKLTRNDIWGIWQIPPVFAQDYERATFANAEQSDLIFAKHTIQPIVRVMEQEINMKCFTNDEKLTTYAKFNMNGLLRADTKARAEFYNVMRRVGGMDGNDIRGLEDMDSYPGGDIKMVESNMIPIDQLRSFYENKTAPSGDPAKVRSDAYEEVNQN